MHSLSTSRQETSTRPSGAALPTAVICGTSPTALCVARDLGRHHIPIQLFDFEPHKVAAATKYRQKSGFTIAISEVDLVDKLIAFATTQTVQPVLFPTSDGMVITVAKYRSELETYFRIAPSVVPSVVEGFVDKRAFHQLCLRHDIDVPKTAFSASAEGLEAAAAEFQFPLILKPASGHLWRDKLNGAKLLVIQSMHDLQQVLCRFGRESGELMIQELVPGQESQIWVAGIYITTRDELGACFVGRKLRQHPPDFGSASLAESRFNEMVKVKSLSLLNQLRFQGMCGTEFKYDERDGKLKIIEVNQRQTLWFSLISAAGIDINYVAYCDLAQLPCELIQTQKDGVKWAYLEKDVCSAFYFMRHGRLSLWEWLRSMHGIKAHAVFNMSDPLPFLLSPRYYLSRLLCRWKKSNRTAR